MAQILQWSSSSAGAKDSESTTYCKGFFNHGDFKSGFKLSAFPYYFINTHLTLNTEGTTSFAPAIDILLCNEK